MSTLEKTGLAVAERQPVTNAIATAPAPSFAIPKSLEDVKMLAGMMVESGFFKDIRDARQAVVKILAGTALGYDSVTSMNAFHIIEGKMTPTAGEITARIKRSGRYNFKTKFIDNTGNPTTNPNAEVFGCSIEFFEDWGNKDWQSIGISTFTKTDAATAGLANKDVWKKYFRNMSFARALTNGARFFCADVFGGPIYTPEELGAEVQIDSEGEQRVVSIPDTTSATPEDERKAKQPPGARELRELYASIVAERAELGENLPVLLSEFVKAEFPSFPTNEKGQIVVGTAENAWKVWDRLQQLIPPKAVEGELLDEAGDVVEPAADAAPNASETAQKLEESLDVPITSGHTKQLLIMFRERGYTDPQRHAFATANKCPKSSKDWTERHYAILKNELDKIPVATASGEQGTLLQ